MADVTHVGVRIGHQDSSQETVISLMGMLVSLVLWFHPFVTRGSDEKAAAKDLAFVGLGPSIPARPGGIRLRSAVRRWALN